MKLKKNKSTVFLMLALMLIVSNMPAQIQPDLSKGVIIYYPFNGDSKNHSPNRIDGTDAIVYGASESYDRNNAFNKAYTFDGRDDYIKIEKQVALNDFSISFWYNTTSSSKGPIFYWEDANFSLSMGGSYKEKGMINFIIGKGDSKKNKYTSLAKTNEGKWHHFLLSFSGREVAVYEDGKKMGRTIKLEPQKNDTERKGYFYIGGYPTGVGEYFQGRIDDLLIYNRKLTDLECKTLFESQSISFNEKLENGLIFHLPFNGIPLNQSLNVMNGLEGAPHGASPSFDRFDLPSGACHFNGVDNYIALGMEAKHPKLSTCFWLNTTSTANSQIIGWGKNSGFNVIINPEHQVGKLMVNLNVAQGKSYSFISPKSVNDGAWHFLAFTYDGTTIKGFIDGQIIYQDSKPGGFKEVVYGDGDLMIGKGGVNYFQGRVDDVFIFNKALTTSEISVIFNSDPRRSEVKIYPTFNKERSLQIEFQGQIKGKIEILICDKNGKELHKRKQRISSQFIFCNLSEFNDEKFIVKVKANGKLYTKTIVFCSDNLT